MLLLQFLLFFSSVNLVLCYIVISFRVFANPADDHVVIGIYTIPVRSSGDGESHFVVVVVMQWFFFLLFLEIKAIIYISQKKINIYLLNVAQINRKRNSKELNPNNFRIEIFLSVHLY